MTHKEREALYNALIQPHHHVLKCVIKTYLHELDGLEENDVFGFVTSRLFRYIHTYDTSKELKTWVITITKRCCFELWKKNRKETDAILHAARLEDYMNGHKTAKSTVFASYLPLYGHLDINMNNLQDSVSDFLFIALKTLSSKDADLLCMRANGYTLEEIARITNKDYSFIKNALFQARKRARQKLIQIKEITNSNHHSL